MFCPLNFASIRIMPYRYDIFISYKRNALAKRWIDEQFKELLELYVELELGRAPEIFIDDQIDSGIDWPIELVETMQISRVVVPLWTKTYFNSEWCCRELAHIVARERVEGYGVPGNPQRLVVPAVIHDCDPPEEALPVPVRRIQSEPLADYFNVRMEKNGKLAEGLAHTIYHRLAPAVARSILSAPTWKPDWRLEAENEIFTALNRQEIPNQERPPGWSG